MNRVLLVISTSTWLFAFCSQIEIFLGFAGEEVRKILRVLCMYYDVHVRTIEISILLSSYIIICHDFNTQYSISGKLTYYCPLVIVSLTLYIFLAPLII